MIDVDNQEIGHLVANDMLQVAVFCDDQVSWNLG